MVSTLVLTEAPVEAVPRPLLVNWLSAEFCAALKLEFELELLVLLLEPVPVALVALLELPVEVVAVAELLTALAVVVVVPEVLELAVVEGVEAVYPPPPSALDCVPLKAPPEVLTQTSLSVSGLCQKLGSTSMTT
jgi:hypothetical protein